MITRKIDERAACLHDAGPHNYVMLAEGFELKDSSDVYATMFCTKCADLIIVAIIPAEAVQVFSQVQ